MVEYRYGVRLQDADAVRRVIQLMAFLSAVGGVSLLEFRVLAGDVIAHPLLTLVLGVGACLGGVQAFLTARWLPDELLVTGYAGFGFLALVSTTTFVTVAGYSFGPRVSTAGTAVYLVPTILAMYVLRRSFALLIVALSIAEYGVLVLLQPGLPAPFAQWSFFAAIVTGMGLLIGGFVAETDRLAGAQRQSKIERLRRFLAPQVADAVLEAGGETTLQPHRRDIAVLFSDLRGFTAFAGRVEPEEVMQVLNDYYGAVGEVVRESEATLGHFAGDGVMAYFNDPVPCDDPAGRAVAMALRLRARLTDLVTEWDRRGYQVGFGMGLAYGHATLGLIGFEDRSDYTPIGSVVNLAARLCAAAGEGQVLVDQKVRASLADGRVAKPVRGLDLKGFDGVRAYALATA